MWNWNWTLRAILSQKDFGMFKSVESRDIDDAAERVGCGKIIDRSCLDNYGYPMRRAYLQFHGSPLPPPSRESPRYPPHSCIWSRWSIAATDSRNYIRLTTATNNYPRATFRSFWRFTWSIPMATEMNALSLNLPLPTINYPCYSAKDSRKLRFGSIASSVSLFLLPRFNDILIKILRSRAGIPGVVRRDVN